MISYYCKNKFNAVHSIGEILLSREKLKPYSKHEIPCITGWDQRKMNARLLWLLNLDVFNGEDVEVVDALERRNEMDKVSFSNRLDQLGQEVSEMKKGLNSVRDMVNNLANNVETSQKLMMEDFKKMLGTFMSLFIVSAHQVRQNVGVGMDLD